MDIRYNSKYEDTHVSNDPVVSLISFTARLRACSHPQLERMSETFSIRHHSHSCFRFPSREKHRLVPNELHIDPPLALLRITLNPAKELTKAVAIRDEIHVGPADLTARSGHRGGGSGGGGRRGSRTGYLRHGIHSEKEGQKRGRRDDVTVPVYESRGGIRRELER